MRKAPRASLAITILDDEDYSLLMSTKGGMEAFGTFVAMILVGRERLQRGQAQRLAGSEALRIDSSLTHILSMARADRKQLDRCLGALKVVAAETGSKPWMHLDEDDRIVIRSFFKFNTNTGWGGPRPGSGRPGNGNQDDSESDHLDSNSEPSRFLSGAGSGAGAGAGSGSDVPTLTLTPAFVNKPEDVDRVAALADRLFPSLGFGDKVRQSEADFRMDWLEVALKRSHEQGKTVWSYVGGTYRGIEAEGGPKSKPNARASVGSPAPQQNLNPPAPVEPEPPPTAEDIAELEKIAAGHGPVARAARLKLDRLQLEAPRG